MNLADLRKPFDPKKVSWRIGSTNADKTKGMALAYIDARDVQDRFDEVCGIEGWANRFIPMHDKKTVCEIGVKVSHGSDLAGPRMEWVWKSDGAGDSDVEAEKGALSDAFKRAAVKWGVGRYLYDLDSPWVAIEPMGRSFKIAQHEYRRLEALLTGKAPPKEPYKDEDGQGQNWIEEQKRFITACRTQEDVQGWVESRADALGRLRRQNLPAWNELRAFKEVKIKALSEESKAA